MDERRAERLGKTLSLQRLLFGIHRVGNVDRKNQGEIDFGNAPEVLAEASAAIRRRRPALVLVDLAAVTYFDSSALQMLVRMAKVADEVSATFRIENPSPAVRRVLEITGLGEHFRSLEPKSRQ